MDLALCIDPHDTQALADALYRASTDQALREKCLTQAPTVAQKFSASTLATQTLAAYEQAAKLHAQIRSHQRL